MKLVPLCGVSGVWECVERQYSLVNPETDHDTETDGQLLGCDQGTANLGGRDLGVVDGNDHGQATDTHTASKSYRLARAGLETGQE